MPSSNAAIPTTKDVDVSEDVSDAALPGGRAAQPSVSLYDGLMTTRALRRFTDEPVDDATVGAILRAAQQGPSGGNIQPWQFVVVTDPSTRGAVGELYARCYRRYESAMLPTVPPFRDERDADAWNRTLAASRHLAAHLGEAPVLVVVCMADIDLTLHDDDGPLDIGTTYASAYPAVQNLMLAARSFGLGSVLTTVVRIEQPALRALLAIPDSQQVIALVPIGHPTGRFGVAPRRPVAAVTHWNRWGDRRRD